MNYALLLDSYPDAFRVYHATEDYLTETNGWNQSSTIVGHSVINLLEKIDLVVACSTGVANAIKTLAHYTGNLITVDNGCDAEFFLEIKNKVKKEN